MYIFSFLRIHVRVHSLVCLTSLIYFKRVRVRVHVLGKSPKFSTYYVIRFCDEKCVNAFFQLVECRLFVAYTTKNNVIDLWIFSCDILYWFLNFICVHIYKKFTIFLELVKLNHVTKLRRNLRTRIYPTSYEISISTYKLQKSVRISVVITHQRVPVHLLIKSQPL